MPNYGRGMGGGRRRGRGRRRTNRRTSRPGMRNPRMMSRRQRRGRGLRGRMNTRRPMMRSMAGMKVVNVPQKDGNELYYMCPQSNTGVTPDCQPMTRQQRKEFLDQDSGPENYNII